MQFNNRQTSTNDSETLDGTDRKNFIQSRLGKNTINGDDGDDVRVSFDGGTLTFENTNDIDLIQSEILDSGVVG